jgi:Holliday junction resolvase-like predicted endonuclease
MLTENEVVDSVCHFLEAAGYKILTRASTSERGIDIVARLPESSGRLLIEAKGETSSKSRTAGFGRPFDSAQVKVHVAEAFYAAACLHATHHSSGDSAGIALPDTPRHHELLNRIRPVIDSLGIAVYFVQRDRSVKAQ